MHLIVEFLRRVWQRGQPDTNAYAVRARESDDRSSMADFVRILRAHDRDQANYPN
jgi:hypothetical protein